MIENFFTISSSDGQLNHEPSGNFTNTSSYPTDAITTMKGTSDLAPINDGMPGFYSNSSITEPSIYAEENGEPAYYKDSSGKMTAFVGQGGDCTLAGKTIYGYIITFDNKPHPYSNSQTRRPCYVINFITNPNYKLQEATYKGWGLTGISWTVGNKLWHGYSIERTPQTGNDRIAYGPVLWNYYSGSYPHDTIVYVTVKSGSFLIGMFQAISDSATYQHTENAKFVELYGPRAITILNSDVIIPSLEDRVDQLEAQVAKLPQDIDEAFALAIDKTSKIFVSR